MAAELVDSGEKAKGGNIYIYFKITEHGGLDTIYAQTNKHVWG